MKIIALIPARAGSKGIPKKNIIGVAGKPLIAWTIEAAKKSKFLNRIIVSSDSPEILSIAKKYGSEAITRPKKYSTDTATASQVMTHILKQLKDKEKYTPDILVYLQPTSPLRTTEDIDKAIKIMIDKKAGALISVAEADNKYLKSFFINKDYLNGIVNNQLVFTNRQKLPKMYMANGAIFIVKEKEFQKNKKFFAKRTIGFKMPPEKSIDIDSMEDIKLIEKYLE